MIQIIAVAYDRVVPLEILIRSFIVQTDPRWVLHVVYDGPAPQEILNAVHPFINGDRRDERIHFYQSPERYQKYGHPNRRTMLQSIECRPGDFILMTNDDNYYCPVFIDMMFKEMRSKVGMIYCDTVHSHAAYSVHVSEIRENYIDMGSFIVRADIAKATGFNYDHFSADGTYAVECLKSCQRKGLRAVKINKPIFVHN
jgi:hypothetical protein